VRVGSSAILLCCFKNDLTCATVVSFPVCRRMYSEMRPPRPAIESPSWTLRVPREGMRRIAASNRGEKKKKSAPGRGKAEWAKRTYLVQTPLSFSWSKEWTSHLRCQQKDWEVEYRPRPRSTRANFPRSKTNTTTTTDPLRCYCRYSPRPHRRPPHFSPPYVCGMSTVQEKRR
jgi:hypothetical protein